MALVGLAVLGVTSTDQALRRLGHQWKRLHRMVYLIAVLGLFHYFLQSKADVAAGDRAGRAVRLDHGLAPACPPAPTASRCPCWAWPSPPRLLTAVVEYAWYGLATRIAPIAGAERRSWTSPTDRTPPGRCCWSACAIAIATALFWAQHRERLRRTVAFGVALYAGGALITGGDGLCLQPDRRLAAGQLVVLAGRPAPSSPPWRYSAWCAGPCRAAGGCWTRPASCCCSDPSGSA